jgi:hypothetical protein
MVHTTIPLLCVRSPAFDPVQENQGRYNYNRQTISYKFELKMV